MAEKQVVLAIFPDEASADNAIDALKAWDKIDDDVKLNALGILAVEPNGKVKEHKLGRHNTGKGAGIGFVLGLIGVALTPILGAGILTWTIGGAIVGRLIHKSMGLDKDELHALGDELRGGKAAVGALVKVEQAPAVAAKLTELGGAVKSYEVEEAELDEAAAEVPEVAAEPAAEAPAAEAPEAAPAEG